MKQRAATVARGSIAWLRRHPVMPSTFRGLATGLVLLALLAIGSGTAVALDRIRAVPPGAVARVGDVVITERQVDEQTRMMVALTGQQPPTDKTQTAKAAVVNQVLDDAAKERGIVIADKTANDKLTELLERGFPQGRDAFIAAMAKAGVPQSMILQWIKRSLAISQLFEQITQGVVPPTDQEVAQAYQTRKAELVVPERRHVRNIALGSKEQAAQVRARLDRGEDFAAVAKEVSLDAETKNNGGDLGTATRDEIPNKAFADAVFAAAPNSVFGPVQTDPQIWSVGQVLEIAAPTQLTLDQIRDSLRSQLYGIRKIDTFNHWLSDQLKDANVRYADEFRPADPTGLPAAPPDLMRSGQPK